MEVEMEEAPEADNGDYMQHVTEIDGEYVEVRLNYVTAIDGDTQEDSIRINQLQDIHDDLQSQIDREHEARERREEAEDDPQRLCEMRNMRTIHDEWDEARRHQEARVRLEQRQQEGRPRREGTAQALQEEVRGTISANCCKTTTTFADPTTTRATWYR
eukprot:6485063-Amphidinium_carterae.2